MSYKLIKSHGSETWDSTGKVSQTELKYFVIGNAPKKEVMLAVWNDAPSELDGLRKDSIRFEGYDDDHNAEFTVAYKKSSSGSTPDTDEEEEPTVSFNCGGGTRHVKYAISQRFCRSSSSSPPEIDIGNGINWNGRTGADSDFSGVDLPDGNLQETYSKVMSMSQLTTAFRRKVASFVGCVNSNRFKGWEPGEVMFMGCSFSGIDKRREKVTVNFNFSIKINEKKAKLLDVPLGDVQGWDYVWPLKFRYLYDHDRNKLSTKLDGAYVATVCVRKNFSELGV